MIKLLIADDQTLIREGLLMVFQHEKDISVCGTAANGKETLDLVVKDKPDVLIMDIQMPEMDGIEVTKTLQESFPEIKVISLTMFEDDYLVADMMEAGAKGYLMKGTDKGKIIEAVHVVYNNGRYLCDGASMKLLRLLAKLKIETEAKAEAEKFTEKEKQIIQLICQEMSTREIADQLFLGENTVEGYRNKIFSKAGVKNMAGLAVFAVRCGLFKL